MMYLKLLVKSYYEYQDLRQRFANRLKVKKDGSSQIIAHEYNMTEENHAVYNSLKEDAEIKEKEIMKLIKSELKKYDVWNLYLKNVKGVGETMAMIIISEFNIHIATTRSKMYAFCGLIPGMKLVKGEKSKFNKYLKSKLLGVLASSFLKSKAPYSKYYYEYKLRKEAEFKKQLEDKKNKEYSKMRIHRMSNRYMIKRFLSDLYEVWRELEGLEVRCDYAEEYLNKKHAM